MNRRKLTQNLIDLSVLSDLSLEIEKYANRRWHGSILSASLLNKVRKGI